MLELLMYWTIGGMLIMALFQPPNNWTILPMLIFLGPVGWIILIAAIITATTEAIRRTQNEKDDHTGNG